MGFISGVLAHNSIPRQQAVTFFRGSETVDIREYAGNEDL